jgi:uroporphyrinogen decarboxylase
MNHRQRALAVLNYQPYDRLPIVHFGFWDETLERWAREGHVTPRQAEGWQDGNYIDLELSRMLGFDFNWYSVFGANVNLLPRIKSHVVETFPDGSYTIVDSNGAVVLKKRGVTSIPKEIDHLFKGRKEWQEIYKPRLGWRTDRLTRAQARLASGNVPFGRGGREALLARDGDLPLGLMCGSLFGYIRNWLGVVGLSYLTADDEPLLDEIIAALGDLAYRGVQEVLATGIHFDFGHFWEDICFKSGPLVNPKLFAEKVGPQYRRITQLLNKHGITIVSLDCDGKIDALVPIWFENGVNTMFPIEVGTWNASIAPWRAQLGKELRGVGGMNKVVFAYDRAAVDAEIERLKPLVALGGFIPCPDHRLAPDAKWENVQYYCQRMRRVFG